MKKLLLLTLLLLSCYDFSTRYKIQQDRSYFQIPEERISLDGEWDCKTEKYLFSDTIYFYFDSKQNDVVKGYYYVTTKDTLLYLLSLNRQGAVRYKLSLFDDSILIYINDSIYFTFINKQYVEETN